MSEKIFGWSVTVQNKDKDIPTVTSFGAVDTYGVEVIDGEKICFSTLNKRIFEKWCDELNEKNCKYEKTLPNS